MMRNSSISSFAPEVATAIGVSRATAQRYLAGLATGVYKNLDELAGHWRAERTFHPTLGREQAQGLMAQWDHAVRQATA